MKKLFRMTAAVVGPILIISAFLLINKKSTSVLVRNEFGNIKSVVLPDSSQVVLNANSAIRFSKNWKNNDSRKVWLEGEAFFNVRHINGDSTKIKENEQFIVYTEELMVEVLGTSFDIRQRRGKTEVVLKSGKVKVSFKDKRTKDVIMKPGDMLVYTVDADTLITTTTSAEDFSAWTEKKLFLNDPTAAEIVEYLEDYFGKNIIFENAEMGKRKIEGPILLTNLDDALFILSTVLNADIIKENTTIIIKPR